MTTTRAARALPTMACALLASLATHPGAWALTGVQVGPSGKTYASAEVACGLHPVNGMAPVVQAGLYNPRAGSRAVVSLGGLAVANVSFAAPDATLWLPNGPGNVAVTLNRRVADPYAFDATITFPGQPNVCIPDTRGNSVGTELETAQSGKSSTTVVPGCALNPRTGHAQPFVNLFDNGAYLLDVSVNNVPLTQLNGSTRRNTPVFLVAGLNVIAATHGAVSTDAFVRDGGSGTCALP